MFLISAVSLSGAVHSGFMVNYVDLAPNHAGMIMGAANTIANVCGIGAPYVAGLLINNNVSRSSLFPLLISTNLAEFLAL